MALFITLTDNIVAETLVKVMSTTLDVFHLKYLYNILDCSLLSIPYDGIHKWITATAHIIDIHKLFGTHI